MMGKGAILIKQNKKIGFIGAGNMGEALVGAIIRSDISDPSRIFITDISNERLDIMKNKYGVSHMRDHFELFSECHIVVIAVKPQQIAHLLSQIAEREAREIRERKLVISIAAGITLQKLEGFLYRHLDEPSRAMLPIMRVMPNTPALVLAGMSGISANRYATPEDIKMTRSLLESMGKVIEFKEEHMDAVTALSGSGPAYVFYLVESMIQGGIEMGLDPEDAVTLTLTTLKGSLKLMQAQNEPPEILRQKVTSPGGTTEAAFNVLESNRVKQNIIEAIAAAARRSKELSQKV
jgi:pyrroline-5-carboxylate reductase